MKEALITKLRDRATSMVEFKEAAHQLSTILAIETASHLKFRSIDIKSPLGKTKGKILAEKIAISVILRSGLAMLPAFMDFFPIAKVGFFGMKRDEKTAIPYLYYQKLPRISPKDRIILLDTMIATGGSATLAIETFLKIGVKESRITLVGILCSSEGLSIVKTRFPKATIIVAGEDKKLSAKKYIIPGVGDFGDRYFGTP